MYLEADVGQPDRVSVQRGYVLHVDRTDRNVLLLGATDTVPIPVDSSRHGLSF